MKTNDTNKIRKNKRSMFYVKRFTSFGFSIVEMVVVIAIMVLMIVGILINNSRFGDDLLLSNLSYDIASVIRQTQSYGLSTKNWRDTINVDSINLEFNRGYGIRFASLDSGSVSGNKKFVMFYESNSDWHCGVETDTTLSGCKNSSEGISNGSYLIPGRSVIFSICGVTSNGRSCYDFANSTGQIKYLDIIFKRSGPYGSLQPDAYISTDIDIYPNAYQQAEITLLAKTGLKRKIIITALGQISVK